MSVLDRINNSKDIKEQSLQDLNVLADEIREKIINVCSENGGHLASNLGIVETTIALYKTFDFPKDKVIFDVGHQCYAYKLLSDRKEKFDTIRLDGGLSGFPDIKESEFDSFTVGHAGTSLSAGIGLAYARDKRSEDYTVINIVGDGAFANGLNLEALTIEEEKPKNYIVIFNDNGMSISKNKNGLYNLISKRTTSRRYVKSKNAIKRIFGNSAFARFLKKIKNVIKRIFNKHILIEKYGFKYVGVVDGNNLQEMLKILERVKLVAKDKAVFLHIKTQKGKGVKRAEERADLYHGVGKSLDLTEGDYAQELGQAINSLIEKDNRITAITCGMKNGTGLETVEKTHPDNFLDVGIAEEYSITLSAGMAVGGLKPIVCVYSTFMQRAYDEILHDVCIQNLPVVFCMDRSGLVGSDGKTHQGVFDISYLSHMPNMTILTPSCKGDLKGLLEYALSLNSPVAIRYPKNSSIDIKVESIVDAPWETIKEGDKLTVLAVGSDMIKLALDFSEKVEGVKVIAVRVLKPLNEEVLNGIKTPIFTLEENALIGGFGSTVCQYFANKNINKKIFNFGIKDNFVKHGTIKVQRQTNGLTVENLVKTYELSVKDAKL